MELCCLKHGAILERVGKKEFKEVIRDEVGDKFLDNDEYEGLMTTGLEKFEDEEGRDQNETLHTVTLTRGFYILTTEVTQELYAAVTGQKPWRDKIPSSKLPAGTCETFPNKKAGESDTRPAYCVNWYEAVAFCNQLSRVDGRDPAYGISGNNVTWKPNANGYRLPTEAEWEYAARAGERHLYSGSDILDDVAWNYHNMNKMEDQLIQPVKAREANAWGIHDMSGNVQEWTWDWYENYPTEIVTDPQGSTATANKRVVRGGSSADVSKLRAAHREKEDPSYAHVIQGFRIVRNAE
jgi:formylglycine-generating enzyme required for sulfatase activity